jgi:hypothetical protein
MRKLSLELEQLTVESFDTDAVAEQRGTVQGHYGTNHTEVDTCGNERSCITYCATCDPTWCGVCD